jgi:ArsR family transcriptional regulator, arsenate/arsenite/antimonite-responsive transcriptional repressor
MTKRSAARAVTTAETPGTTAVGASTGSAVCRAPLEEDRSTELVRIAKALSDPIRVRMLEMMSQGRSCCGLTAPAARGVPGTDEPRGICVCEFQERFELGQSKTSYHLRVLKEAGLVHEETRGKWTFYAVDHDAVERSLTVLRALLGS